MRLVFLVAGALALADACSVSTSSSSPPMEPDPLGPPERSVGEATVTVNEDPADSDPSEPSKPAAGELTVPHDVPPLDAPCETRSEFAVNQVTDGMAFAAKGCTADIECVLANKSTGCQGACPGVVAKEYADAYESFRASIDQRVCSTYRDDGCPYATPRCVNASPKCVDGACQLVRAGSP